MELRVHSNQLNCGELETNPELKDSVDAAAALSA